MNILRLSAYFAPEITAASHLMNDLCESFSKNDINCIFYTPQPTRGVSKQEHKNYKKYEELYNGYIKINRFPMFCEKKNPILRAIRYSCCAVIEYYKGIHVKDIDLVFSSSTPPIQGMISAMVAKKLSKKNKKKVPFVYNLQDVFPDSLINSGMTKKGSLLWKVGRKLEDYTYQNADKIIVISNSMKRNILKKGVLEGKVEVISNWIDTDNVRPIKKEDNILFAKMNIDYNKFIVLYAGNFGEAQGADIILKVAEKLKKFQEIQFVIFGGGTHFENAQNQAEKMNNVIITKLLSQEYVSNVYSLGDVALITCKPGTGSAGMPSKTWSIMACNTRIIASFDKDSDLAEIIKDSKAGVCVEPGSVDKLCDAIKMEYFKWKEEYQESSIRDYVKKMASKDSCVNRYISLLKGC